MFTFLEINCLCSSVQFVSLLLPLKPKNPVIRFLNVLIPQPQRLWNMGSQAKFLVTKGFHAVLT